MNLYLDLNKAVSQMPSTGQDSPDEDRAAAAESHSYGKDYAGAASGDGMNAGSVTKAEDEDEDKVKKAESVLEEADKERNAIGSFNSNVVKKPNSKDKEDAAAASADLGKAFAVIPDEKVMEDYYKRNKEVNKSATRLMQAVAARASYLTNIQKPNVTEVEFLKSLGYTDQDIDSGTARITGLNRSKFNKWLHNNLLGSIDTLTKSVNNL